MKRLVLALFLSCSAFADMSSNDIPFRLQWMYNLGYCGEVSLISAGLYYGQYISQYDARAIATKDGTQTDGELLIGVNDKKTAKAMHLEHEEWHVDREQNTEQFLIWLKQQIVNGNPVAIGVYANQHLFYGTTNPDAGDPDYDHIVSVVSLTSNHSRNDPTYYGDDQVGFSDNGLLDNGGAPVYYFSYPFDSFQKDREHANRKHGSVYSLANDGRNYGIAITGVKDLHGDTLPVRIDTDYNDEEPHIEAHSNARPAPMPLTLTVTISSLQENVLYILYRYDDLERVPDSEFNAKASHAVEKWPFQIASGSTYTLTEKIQSSDTVVYRCVAASAP